MLRDITIGQYYDVNSPFTGWIRVPKLWNRALYYRSVLRQKHIRVSGGRSGAAGHSACGQDPAGLYPARAQNGNGAAAIYRDSHIFLVKGDPCGSGAF